MSDVRGFSLIEVLAALVVLALALGYGSGILSQSAEAVRRADAQVQALAQAESLLAEVGYVYPLRAGSFDGETPEGGRWRLDIAPVSAGEALARPLYEVTATLAWGLGPTARRVTLVTRRVDRGAL
jgi:general secretion pathway protein I